MAEEPRPDGPRIAVLVNPGSGSGDGGETRAQIARTLALSRRAHTIDEIRPGALREQIRQQLAGPEKPGILAVAGGDGSINTAASELLGSGVCLGLIPCGTFNLGARDLGIPLDAGEATRVLIEGIPRYRPLGRVNGHPFLVNASFGLYRRVLQDREQIKRRLGRYRPVAVLSALITLLRHHRSYDVELTVDGHTRRLRTPMVLLGMNALQLEGVDPELARGPERGRMACVVLRPTSRLGLLRLAARGALRGLGEAENLETHLASSVHVRMRPRRISVAVDGELILCNTPLHFEVIEEGLRVMTPRDPAPRR